MPMREPRDDQRAQDDERGGENHERPEKFRRGAAHRKRGAEEKPPEPPFPARTHRRHQIIARDVQQFA